MVVVFFVLDGIYVPKSFVLSSFFFSMIESVLYFGSCVCLLLKKYSQGKVNMLQVTSDE